MTSARDEAIEVTRTVLTVESPFSADVTKEDAAAVVERFFKQPNPARRAGGMVASRCWNTAPTVTVPALDHCSHDCWMSERE